MSALKKFWRDYKAALFEPIPKASWQAKVLTLIVWILILAQMNYQVFWTVNK